MRGKVDKECERGLPLRQLQGTENPNLGRYHLGSDEVRFEAICLEGIFFAVCHEEFSLMMGGTVARGRLASVVLYYATAAR